MKVKFKLKILLAFLSLFITTTYVAAEPKECLTDPLVIEDLKKLRLDLEEKRKNIEAKEQELETREKAFQEELARMKEIRDEISGATEVKRKLQEERVGKLVETIETMSPKSSSVLLSTVNEDLAIAAMSRVSTAKLAKIMNVMEPAKASRLSELLTTVKTTVGRSPVSQDMPKAKPKAEIKTEIKPEIKPEVKPEVKPKAPKETEKS